MMFANATRFLLENARPEDRPLRGDETTYRTLAARVRRLAATVAASTPPGAHVLIDMQSTSEGIATLLAVMAAGRVAVPLADDVRNAAAGPILAETEAAARCGAFRRAAPEVRDLPEVGSAPAGRAVYSRPTMPVDPAIVLYTSGTTAAPKGVVLSHGNIIANTTAILQAAPLHRDDRVGLVLPFTYSYGLSMLYTSLRAGAQLVPASPLLLPGDFLPDAAEAGVTVFAGVPRHYEKLLAMGGFEAARLPRLRLAHCAGGRLPVASIGELRARFPDARVAPMYGQTEATARLSILAVTDLDNHASSIGRGIPGVTLRVLDGDGRPVAAGEQGELYAQGPNVMLGYLKAEEATRSVLTSRGLRTRDLAVTDEQGFIELVGRTADFVKPGGVRVSLIEVETVAEQLDTVDEAVALRDGDSEEIRLEIQLSAGATERDVVRGLRHTLPASHVPLTIVAVSEIPRTPSGKKIRWRERERTQAPSG